MQDDEALADFSEAIRLDSRCVNAYLCRASVWLERQDYAKCLSDCEAAIRLEPKNPYALLSRGACWLAKKEAARAATDFDAALRLDPHSPGLLMYRAWMRQRLGQNAEALADLERALVLDTHLSDAHAEKAAILVQLNRIDAAIAALDAAIAIDREFGDYRVQRAHCRLLKGEPAQARADLDSAIKLDEDNADAYRLRALLARDTGDLKSAIDDLTHVIDFDLGTSDDLDNRGQVWEQNGEFDRALADYCLAVKLEPRTVGPLFHRALVLHYRKNLPAQALDDLTEVLRVDQAHVGALVERGRIQLESRRFDEAIADLSRAIEHVPGDPLLYFARGTAWQAKRSFRKALDDFDRSVRLLKSGQTAPFALNAQAWIWATCPEASLRHGGQAIDSAERACKETEWKDPVFLVTLSAAHAENGDFEAAVKWAEKAIALLPAGHPSRGPWRETVERYKQKKPIRE